MIIIGMGILLCLAYLAFAWYVSSPHKPLPLSKPMIFNARRLAQNPIIHHEMEAGLTKDSHREGYVNINSPCVIRVPGWVNNPLGKYYLYFAHHKGDHIRLAYAHNPAGPWKIYAPGTLQLQDVRFARQRKMPTTELWAQLRILFLSRKDAGTRNAKGMQAAADSKPHIASPDVWVDDQRQEIRLYCHGLVENGTQQTCVAVSQDGLHFNALPGTITASYLRIFYHRKMYYGIAMPGLLYRSRDGLSGFEVRPRPLTDARCRHIALWHREDLLYIFWTRVGDAPERILCSRMDIAADDWKEWKMTEPVEVLRPETDWEGGDLPVEASLRGEVYTRANQLRDPFIFDDQGQTYLLYSAAGEHAIGIAALETVRG